MRTHFNVIPEDDRKEPADNDFRYHLAVNDSFSFFYTTQKTRKQNQLWKAPTRPDIIKELHHSRFTKRYSREVFHGVAFPDRRRPYLVRDTIVPAHVVIDSTPKKFRDWRCRDAYAVISPGDTVFALLAIDYKLPFGPLDYSYFPWLPVEIYHPKYRFELIANKIEAGPYELVFPVQLPIVQRGETLQKRRKRIKKI
jgi:hypothetical protein